MKSYLRLKQDEFAEKFLDEKWPENWDQGTGEWDLVLPEWQERVDAAITDAFHELRAEVNEQRDDAAIRKAKRDVGRGPADAVAQMRFEKEHAQEAADARRELRENR